MARPEDPRKHAEWRKRLAKFKKSKQTIPEFCKAEGVTLSTFYWWKRRLAGEDGRKVGKAAVSAGGNQGVVAKVREQGGGGEGGSAVITIRLPNGVSLEMPLDNMDAVRTVVEQLVRGERMPKTKR